MQRCKAKSKRSGEQCKNFAIKQFGVCRIMVRMEDLKQKKDALDVRKRQFDFQLTCHK